VKPAEILKRLRVQSDDEILSRIHVYDWNKSFKEGRTQVEKMRRLRLLQGKLWPAFFATLKASYYSTIFGQNEPLAQLIFLSFLMRE
jgi:hypothetical protein